MPIDQATIARLRDLLAKAPTGGTEDVRTNLVIAQRAAWEALPALLEAAERCERATEFLVTEPGMFAVVIRKCFGHRLPVEPMWKVHQAGSVLNTDGDWEHEPQPSSRDDAFYRRCRFHSFEAADAAAHKSIDAARAGKGERAETT